jgi:hypothetical protein
VIGRTHRTRIFAGLAALGLALTAIAPAAAQTGPTITGGWVAGPGAAGPNTMVGRVETPRPRQNISSAANLLVSGWAGDTTAQGWAGGSGVEVWSGLRDRGTKLSTGTVGLARPDVAEALGPNLANSGFSAIVPAAALKDIPAGGLALNVYILTPGKGTYLRPVGVNLLVVPPLAYPQDPVIGITKPQDGTAITQRQVTNRFSFTGFALDRNPITNPAIQTTGPGCSGCAGARGGIGTSARGAGIASILANIDSPLPTRGDNSPLGLFGTPCASCLYAVPTVSNKGSFNVPGVPQASIITRSYGSQFDYSGWSIALNPMLLSPGWHTLYVTATSSITGRQNTVSSTFNVLDMGHLKIQP